MWPRQNGGRPGGSATISNSDFIGNLAAGDSYNDLPGLGGGVYGGGTISNSILRNNKSTSGDPNVSGRFTFAYSDLEGSGGSAAWNAALGTDGGGNIDADPHFVAPGHWNGTTWLAGGANYQLAAGSPCIDAGANGLDMGPY